MRVNHNKPRFLILLYVIGLFCMYGESNCLAIEEPWSIEAFEKYCVSGKMTDRVRASNMVLALVSYGKLKELPPADLEKIRVMTMMLFNDRSPIVRVQFSYVARELVHKMDYTNAIKSLIRNVILQEEDAGRAAGVLAAIGPSALEELNKVDLEKLNMFARIQIKELKQGLSAKEKKKFNK